MSTEHESMKAQARKAVEEYHNGRSTHAPTAFDALYWIIDHAFDNPSGWLLLGWITGAFSKVRAKFLDTTHDPEAGAWYVQVSDKDVHHTTEVVANIDWTRDGELVGIELLPDSVGPTQQPKGAIPVEVFEKMKAAFERALVSKKALPSPPLLPAGLEPDRVAKRPYPMPGPSCPSCRRGPCDMNLPACVRRREQGLK